MFAAVTEIAKDPRLATYVHAYADAYRHLQITVFVVSVLGAIALSMSLLLHQKVQRAELDIKFKLMDLRMELANLEALMTVQRATPGPVGPVGPMGPPGQSGTALAPGAKTKVGFYGATPVLAPETTAEPVPEPSPDQLHEAAEHTRQIEAELRGDEDRV